MSRSLNLVSGLYLKISILTIVAGLVLRIVLLFNGQTSDLGFHRASGARYSCWAP